MALNQKMKRAGILHMKPIEYKRTIQGMSCIFLKLKYGS